MTSVVDVHKRNGKRKYFDVYIGRAVNGTEFNKDSVWCKPKSFLNQERNWREIYEDHVRNNLMDRIEELRGKKLGCWCINTDKIEPVKCHGQILLKLLREKNR